jgi:hypothetical protein
MNKTISMMTFADLSKGGGATTQDGKLKRTVLFTLDEHEEIDNYKYFVLQRENKNHFACIIENTLKDTFTFVFNGKRIVKGDCFFNFPYLNVHEKNGYAVRYTFQGMDYVNIKGQVYGPFDTQGMYDNDSSLEFARYNNGDINCHRFYYRKTEAGKRNYYLHYHGVKEGPFDGILFPKKNSAYADCDYLYLLSGKCYAHYCNGVNKEVPFFHVYYDTEHEKWHININGKDSRGYGDAECLHFSEKGKYIYTYIKNRKHFININGEDSRSDNMTDVLRVSEGNYIFNYIENGKHYVNINGEDSRGYDKVEKLRITKSGNYAYIYEENGKAYVNINGSESRGYDDVTNLRLNESGNYAYIYKENERTYININGSDSRGYDEINLHSLCLKENGMYAYQYSKNGRAYVNINGEDSNGGYESVDTYSLLLGESGAYAYLYRENGTGYININGKSESYDEINLYSIYIYDDGNYIYAYKKNGKWYVNINGENSNGCNEIYQLNPKEEGGYIIYYLGEEGKICKYENGEETETEYLSGMGWDDEIKFFYNKNREEDLKIYSTDEEHSFSSFRGEYVVIDGKRYGNSYALYAWYDRTKQAFIWNTVEDKELVLYEYKLKINGSKSPLCLYSNEPF